MHHKWAHNTTTCTYTLNLITSCALMMLILLLTHWRDVSQVWFPWYSDRCGFFENGDDSSNEPCHHEFNKQMNHRNTEWEGVVLHNGTKYI